MKTLKAFYKLPLIVKIFLGLITFPLGTMFLLMANTVARIAEDISDIQEKIDAVWADPCDSTVEALIDKLEPKRAVTINVGVTSVSTDIPQKLSKLMQSVAKNENISDSVKERLRRAIANNQFAAGKSTSGYNQQTNNMNEQARQMEELNEQMRQFDEINRQNEFMFQEQMRQFDEQQMQQQQQQFTDQMLHMGF